MLQNKFVSFDTFYSAMPVITEFQTNCCKRKSWIIFGTSFPKKQSPDCYLRSSEDCANISLKWKL